MEETRYWTASQALMSGGLESARERSGGQPVNGAVLDSLQATVVAHTWTALDALEDWQDMVPEEVNELRARLASLKTREN